MKRKNNPRKRLTPEQLFAVIYEAVANYHLKPNGILSLVPQGELHFSSDEAVIDEFHHLFEQAGDLYSRIIETDNAGSDIDPEDDDERPEITSQLICRDIGLIRISKFKYDTCARDFEIALSALSTCTSLILDLRDNPGGLHFQALDIAQMLLNEGNLGGQIKASKNGFRSVDYTLTPKKFVTTESALDGSDKSSASAKRKPNLFGNKPIVVLVNENTKSAAEVLASILHDNQRAKLIGRKTYGKGRGTNNLKIPNGLELQVLGFYWFTPAGECIGSSLDDPNRGIIPDYFVKTDDQYHHICVQVLEEG